LASLANDLYRRVEWPWMLKPDHTLAMGWRPNQGFIDAAWRDYN
jgi:hypothetical protein